MDDPIVINGVEVKSGEPIAESSQIETLLMDNDKKFRDSGPSEKVNGQTVVKSDDRVQLMKTSEIVKAQTPDREELQKLVKRRGLEWDDDIPNRTETYYASDERVDRHGDIVRQNWDFENFKKNPLLLWSHNWDSPPIGSHLDWKVEKREDGDYNGKALRLLSLFASQEQSTFASDIMRLVKSGILKTGSVGFYPIEVLDVKDQGEREALGLGRWGVVVNRSELVEFSPTSVPANTGAHRLLSMAKSQGGLQEGDHLLLRRARQAELITLGLQDLTSREDEKWISMWKDIFPDAELQPLNKLQEEPIDFLAKITELQSQIDVLTRSVSDVQESQDGILADIIGLKNKSQYQNPQEEDPFAAALADQV